MDCVFSSHLYFIFDKRGICYCSLVSFFVSFYIISSLQITYLNQKPIMKKILFSLLVLTSLSCQEDRPHGNQYKLPELTPNNYLMGNLNENRSSYEYHFMILTLILI